MKSIIRFVLLKVINQRVKYYILWNRFYFWLNDVSYGKNMRVFNRFYLKKADGAQLVIGDNFTFSSGGHKSAKQKYNGMYIFAISRIDDRDWK